METIQQTGGAVLEGKVPLDEVTETIAERSAKSERLVGFIKMLKKQRNL